MIYLLIVEVSSTQGKIHGKVLVSKLSFSLNSLIGSALRKYFTCVFLLLSVLFFSFWQLCIESISYFCSLDNWLYLLSSSYSISSLFLISIILQNQLIWIECFIFLFSKIFLVYEKHSVFELVTHHSKDYQIQWCNIWS